MIRVEPIPIYSDNYVWCLHDNNSAWLVDPGEFAPVEGFLTRNSLKLKGIIITHCHWDHITAVPDIAALYGAPVYGPEHPSLDCVSVNEGDSIEILGIPFSVWHAPGHTLEHLIYYTNRTATPMLLCGDTLFSVGCGRINGGDVRQLFASIKRIANLPKDTQLYCTHEYTLANIAFAKAVDNNNAALLEREREVKQLRKRDKPSLPTNLEQELLTNPFLRCGEPIIISQCERHSKSRLGTEEEVFVTLRGWKDRF